MPLRDDVAEYFRSYDRDSFEVFAAGDGAPSEADVVEFEQRIGFRLPDEFRDFTMSPLGGLYIAAREELWPRPKMFDVGPAWSFDYAVKVFGLSAEIPGWLDLRVQYDQFVAAGEMGLVPVLQVETDADRYCVTPQGDLVLWAHDIADEPSPVDGTFSDLLMLAIAELEERLRWKRGVEIPPGSPRPA